MGAPHREQDSREQGVVSLGEGAEKAGGCRGLAGGQAEVSLQTTGPSAPRLLLKAQRGLLPPPRSCPRER